MHDRFGLLRPITLATLMALTLAACGTGPEGPGTSESPGASVPAATPDVTPAATEAPATPLPMTQSESEWGPIWDGLPSTYPVPVGAEPAEADTGPVSAAYTVTDAQATPRAIADFYQAALEDRGYATGLDGPLEDGALTVWSTNGYGCDSVVTIRPRGDESLITVLYGTGCRFE